MECKEYLIMHESNTVIMVTEHFGGTIFGNPDLFKIMTKCEALAHFADYAGYELIHQLPDDENCPC